MVSLPYKQRTFIIYDNDVALKICLSASSAFKVTVRDWLGSGFGNRVMVKVRVKVQKDLMFDP